MAFSERIWCTCYCFYRTQKYRDPVTQMWRRDIRLSKKTSGGWLLNVVGKYVVIQGRLRKRKTKKGFSRFYERKYTLLEHVVSMEKKRMDWKENRGCVVTSV